MPPVPFLEVRVHGTYREIGRAVGEEARAQIAAAIAYYREHFVAMAGREFAAAERLASQYLVYARRYLPAYVEELQGMAEASGQSLEALMVPNCGEEFTCPVDQAPPRLARGGGRRRSVRASAGASSRPHRPLAAPGCTGVAVVGGGRTVVGHNMDWYAVDMDKNVLFDVTTPDGTRFITLAGVPYLPILGMSSHGIAYVGNSVYGNDGRLGVPNVFVRRWALEASSIAEAQQRATMPWRARGSNHLLAHRDGSAVDVETSAGSADVCAVTGGYAHTNHYTLSGMASYEGYWAGESRDRLARATELLSAGLARGDDIVDLVADVLRDHTAGVDSICAHPDGGDLPAELSVTVASLICDLDAMAIHVCAGPPCQNPYRTYAF